MSRDLREKPSQAIIDLYDAFTHGRLSRRSFLDRLVLLAGGSAAATAVLALLKNDYAMAETVPEGDSRIRAKSAIVQGPDGAIACYQAEPAAEGKYPAVIVIHENRGLNPHIKDVTRRLAVAGYLGFAPDLLSAQGGTPSDEDKARDMIGKLDAARVVVALRAVDAALREMPDSTGKVGVVGFCWGGGYANQLAVAEPTLNAAVAYYGRQPKAEDVPAIKAPLLLHYAGLDQATNAGIPAYEAALKANGKSYEIYVYDGANHAFNNDTNPARYDKAAADLAWTRTLDFLKRNLG